MAARPFTLERRKFVRLPERTMVFPLPEKEVRNSKGEGEEKVKNDEKEGEIIRTKRRIATEDQDGKRTSHTYTLNTVFVLDAGFKVGIPLDGDPSREDAYPDSIDALLVILDKKKYSTVACSE